jgi:hypothetical protein
MTIRGSHRRICSGCGRLTAGQLCPACQAKLPTTTRRGYGREHQLERQHWAPLVEAGEVHCRRCNERIQPGATWDLGHPDAQSPGPRAPEHRACNRGATAAVRGA